MAHIKIAKKIAKYRVLKPETSDVAAGAAPKDPLKTQDNVIWMHEKLERPEVLIGSTYKIKTPVSDHAMYVTINDILLNEGTPHGRHSRSSSTRRISIIFNGLLR
jgi:hypothetical protein